MAILFQALAMRVIAFLARSNHPWLAAAHRTQSRQNLHDEVVVGVAPLRLLVNLNKSRFASPCAVETNLLILHRLMKSKRCMKRRFDYFGIPE
jgi:hypothetical protein